MHRAGVGVSVGPIGPWLLCCAKCGVVPLSAAQPGSRVGDESSAAAREALRLGESNWHEKTKDEEDRPQQRLQQRLGGRSAEQKCRHDVVLNQSTETMAVEEGDDHSDAGVRDTMDEEINVNEKSDNDTADAGKSSGVVVVNGQQQPDKECGDEGAEADRGLNEHDVDRRKGDLHEEDAIHSRLPNDHDHPTLERGSGDEGLGDDEDVKRTHSMEEQETEGASTHSDDAFKRDKKSVGAEDLREEERFMEVENRGDDTPENVEGIGNGSEASREVASLTHANARRGEEETEGKRLLENKMGKEDGERVDNDLVVGRNDRELPDGECSQDTHLNSCDRLERKEDEDLNEDVDRDGVSDLRADGGEVDEERTEDGLGTDEEKDLHPHPVKVGNNEEGHDCCREEEGHYDKCAKKGEVEERLKPHSECIDEEDVGERIIKPVVISLSSGEGNESVSSYRASHGSDDQNKLQQSIENTVSNSSDQSIDEGSHTKCHERDSVQDAELMEVDPSHDTCDQSNLANSYKNGNDEDNDVKEGGMKETEKEKEHNTEAIEGLLSASSLTKSENNELLLRVDVKHEVENDEDDGEDEDDTPAVRQESEVNDEFKTGEMKQESIENLKSESPKVKTRKRQNRFNGLSEEEVAKKLLPDLITKHLDILIIGINPGMYAAFKGHHYAGPGNHFWKCMFLSGLIPHPMSADDDYKLLDLGIGFTNIVARATRGSVNLSKKEILEGAETLKEKLRTYEPRIAVFNGKGIYEAFSGKKEFHFGKQPKPMEGTNTHLWVMPNSSARCAQLPRAVDKVPFYAALRKFRDYLKGELTELTDDDVVFSHIRLRSFNEKRSESNADKPHESKSEISKNIDPTTGKKRRGRPPKVRPDGSLPPPKRRITYDADGNVIVRGCNPIDPLTGKKKRGRPKKEPGDPPSKRRVKKVNLNNDQEENRKKPTKIVQPLPPFSPNENDTRSNNNLDNDTSPVHSNGLDNGNSESHEHHHNYEEKNTGDCENVDKGSNEKASLLGDDGHANKGVADVFEDLSTPGGDCSSERSNAFNRTNDSPSRMLKTNNNNNSFADLLYAQQQQQNAVLNVPSYYAKTVDAFNAVNYSSQQQQFLLQQHQQQEQQQHHQQQQQQQLQEASPSAFNSAVSDLRLNSKLDDVSTKSISVLESLVDQIPAATNADSVNDSGVFSMGSSTPSRSSVGPSFSPNAFTNSMIDSYYSQQQQQQTQQQPIITSSSSSGHHTDFSVSSLVQNSTNNTGGNSSNVGSEDVSNTLAMQQLDPFSLAAAAEMSKYTGFVGSQSTASSAHQTNPYMFTSSAFLGAAGNPYATMNAAMYYGGQYHPSSGNYNYYNNTSTTSPAVGIGHASSASNGGHTVHVPNPSYPYGAQTAAAAAAAGMAAPYAHTPHYSQTPYF